MISFHDIRLLAPGTPLSSFKEKHLKGLKASLKAANVTTEFSAFQDLSEVTHIVDAFEDNPDRLLREAAQTIKSGVEELFNNDLRDV